MENSIVYVGVSVRQGKYSRTVKIGETSNGKARLSTINSNGNYGQFKFLATYQVVNDKPTRLLFESVVRQVFNTRLYHYGNDEFVGDITNAEIINLFNHAIDIARQTNNNIIKGL